MRNLIVVLWMLLCSIASSAAQVSVGIGLPGVNIGINLAAYPQLVPVPGYPVYYAPQMNSNYFFYDGMYWVYRHDNWYASSWYNGPWGLVNPQAVPLFVLRVPVRYYRQPPTYFRGWSSDAPPRWGEHWGSTWEQSRSGWDNWNRSAVYAPAPLPVYQRQYSGNRYPHVEQQQVLQSQNYRYQPQDAVVQQHYQAQQVQRAPAPRAPAQQAPSNTQAQTRQPQQTPSQRQAQSQQAAAQHQAQSPQQAPAKRQTQQPQQAAAQHPSQQSQQVSAQHQPQQPQQGAAQHQPQHPQQAGAKHEQQQAPKKGPEKGEPQGGEHNK
jgi:hypothetical protein